MSRAMSRAMALAAALLLSTAAGAQQQGFALDRFEPGKPGSEWFMLDSLDIEGHWRPHFQLAFDWANKPLVIYNEDGSENRALVRNQIMAHLGLAVNLFDRARLSFSIPLGAYQDGSAGVVGGVLYTAPGAGAFGDPRIGADVRLYGSYASSFVLVAGADLHVPLGSKAQFTGDGRVRIEPHLDAAGNASIFAYAVRLGYQYHRRQDSYGEVQLANQLTMGAAAGVRVLDGRLLIGPELTGATAVGKQGYSQTLTSPFELIAGAHYRWNLLDIGAGTGPGLTHGYGSPAWRTIFSLNWGFNDPAQASSEEIVVAPLRAEAPPAKVALAPPPVVEAPVVEAPVVEAPVVIAKVEAAPEPEDDEVEVEDEEIKIKEQVQFATDSAEILHESDTVLTQLANAIQKHREIASLRVEGHTDSQCARRFSHEQCVVWNSRLSRDRAKAVMDWLVAHGIAASRLSSEGFGLAVPIADNKTEAGRRKNRRVELHILARGHKEAPVEEGQ